MTVETIAISAIDASDRLQPVDALKVEAIAAAIEEKGLIQPIVVRPEGGGYRLTAGGHRLAALILLGWLELTVGVHVIIREEETADDARLTEIYENIFRSPPTALNLAIQLRTAQAIHDVRRGETRGRKSKVDKLQEDKIILESRIIFSERFTKAAARRINLAPCVIADYCRVAKALDEDTIAEIRGTMVEDNLVELKQLVEIPAEKRRAAAGAIKRGEAKKVSEARVAIGIDKPKIDDPQARILAQLIHFWGLASGKTKQQFMHDVGIGDLIKSGKPSACSSARRSTNGACPRRSRLTTARISARASRSSYSAHSKSESTSVRPTRRKRSRM